MRTRNRCFTIPGEKATGHEPRRRLGRQRAACKLQIVIATAHLRTAVPMPIGIRERSITSHGGRLLTRAAPVPFFRTALLPLLTVAFLLGGCTEFLGSSTERNDLASMQVVPITIRDGQTGAVRTTYTAYVADTAETQRIGLMNVTHDALPADHGMIFVFEYDRAHAFWMKNTIIPLDIAYIRSDGTIVKTYTMEPLRETSYYSVEPARFALEVRGGQLAQWGIREGDRVDIPAELFN